MSGWNEDTLRKAASWKAFKEGKALFEAGAVVDAKSGSTGWQGAVRSGSRPLRVTVRIRSATDLETQCPCPENRSTGALCAHAVALGLAVISPKPASPPRAAVLSRPAAPAAPAVPSAWQILLPLNWRESLQRGKLSATLAAAPDEAPSPADDRLQAWLTREAVAPKPILSLNLDAARVPAFLEAIADHPRLAVGREQLSISIRSGVRFALDRAERAGEAIQLVPAPESGPWTGIGGVFWKITADSVIRVGEGTVPPALAPDLAALAAGKPLAIPLDRFLSRLDAWQEWVAFPDGSWIDSLHFIPAPVAVELTLEGSLQHLEARVAVRYGDSPPLPPGLGTVPGLPRLREDRCEVRNLAAEERAVQRLSRAGFQPEDFSTGSWSLKGESAILEFLTTTLPSLRNEWSVREGERFGQVQKQIAIVSPRIDIVGSGEDWLSFDLSFQSTAGDVVSAAEVRRLLRSGRSSGQVAGGRHLVISNEVSELIDPLFSELDLRQENGRFMASAQAGELIKEIREKLRNPQKEKREESLFTFCSPAGFQAALRPYQAHGAAWLHERVTRFGGALLADDMGLGKTIQTIACIECLFSESADDSGVVLVLATASLLGNWKAEFGKFAPGRVVRILHGASRDKERERVGPGEVVVTSYGTLARDLAWHLKRDYRAVVLDEASLLRNPDTDHARAVAKLKSAHRIALTGTPIENGVRDLWSVFRFLQPGWLGTREVFKERYESPIAAGESAAPVMERLRVKISPFLLRRTKEQVAPELPSKLLIDEFCDLSPEQQAVYKDLLVEGRKRVDAVADSGNKGAARMQMLTALLRLRQTCCDLALLGNDRLNQLLLAKRSAKIQRLLELMEEAISGNHRMLVFSQFQKQLLEIEKCVTERGWECLRLDGQTRNRQHLVDRFQQAGGPPIFLISLKAGGYGLNLTAADTVVHFDPWWNPAAEAQATDRAHRIGQTRPLTVYRLLTRGTVEEKVVRLQSKKRELATAIDEGGAGDASGWSMEDLESVLGA